MNSRKNAACRERLDSLSSGSINPVSVFGDNSREALLDKWTTTGNFAPDASLHQELAGEASYAVRRLIRVRRSEWDAFRW
jgi:hypothetical protein